MKKYILGGSLEPVGKGVRAGMFVGSHEWDVNKTLRYIEAYPKDFLKGDTVQTTLERIYDNSTGCLIKGDFKMKDI